MDNQTNDSVNLFDPNGNPVNVAASDQQRALEQGFRVPSPEEVAQVKAKQDSEDKYGDRKTEAGLAGAARGLTFGLSDQLMTKTGLVKPETLEGLKEENPISSMAGQGAGIVTGLAGSAVKGALGAANLVGKAAGLGEAIAGSGAAKAIAGKYGSQFLGSAVEGALYGTGNVISEQALGDPNLNAERIMSEVGLSAVLGGSLGAGFSAMGDAGGAAVSSLNKAKESLMGSTQGAVAKGTGILYGNTTDEMLSLIKNRGALLSKEENNNLINDLSTTFNRQFKEVNKASAIAKNEIRPLENNALIDNSYLPEAQKAFSKTGDEIQSVIKQIEERPALYKSSYAERLKDLSTDFNKIDQGSASEIANGLDAFKQKLSPLLKYNKTISPELEPTVNLLSSMTRNLKNTLEDQTAFGQGAARQASYNTAYNEFATLQKEVQKSFMRKVATRTGRDAYEVNPAKLKASLKDPYRQDLLQQYQESSHKLVDQIDQMYKATPAKSFDKEAMDSVINKSASLHEAGSQNAELVHTIKDSGKFGVAIRSLSNIEKVANKNGSLITRLAKGVFNPIAHTTTAVSSSIANFKSAIKTLQTHAQDVPSLINNLSKATDHISDGAPLTAGHISTNASNALNFLQSKMPKQAESGVLDQPTEVSKTEQAKFMHYYEIVNKPTRALDELRSGTLRPETIETLQAVYPTMYKEMQKEVMKELTDRNPAAMKKMPYARKMMLTMFLGTSLTHSLSPEGILANQKAFAPPGMPPGQAPAPGSGKPPTQAGMKNLDQSSAYTTPFQAAGRREVP